MLSEILGEAGWNTYMVGKWHLCPTDEMNLASTRRNWPTGRGFERWYGFLGAETNQWYPDLVYDNHPVDQPQTPRGRLPLHGRHHRQGARVHQGRQGDRARQTILPLLRARCLPRAAPRPEGMDRQVQGPVRHGLRGHARADAGQAEEARHRARRHRAAPDQPDRHARDRKRPGWHPVPGARLHPAMGFTERRREASLRADGRGIRRFSWPRRPSHRAPARLPRVHRSAREHHGRRRLRQRSQRRGRPERIGQRDEVRQRGRRTTWPRTWRSSTISAARRPTTTTRTAGRWRSTRRSRCGSATSSTAAPPTRASSPGRRASRREGEIRDQYHHAIDIVPTVLDVLGRRSTRRRSRATSRASSTASACAAASTTPKRRRQGRPSSTRCSARASIWHEGWKAVTTHPTIAGWGHFNEDEWELYHTDVDRSELHDLAAEQPDKVRELVNIWFAEAGYNIAFPLDDRSPLEILDDTAAPADRAT